MGKDGTGDVITKMRKSGVKKDYYGTNFHLAKGCAEIQDGKNRVFHAWFVDFENGYDTVRR